MLQVELQYIYRYLKKQKFLKMNKLHVKMSLTMTTYIHEQHHLVLVQYFHTIDRN